MQKFLETSKDFFVNEEYKNFLQTLSLNSLDKVFRFDKGNRLSKENLAPWRERISFDCSEISKTVFLKRYTLPPLQVQLKNWISHKRIQSLAESDVVPTLELNKKGINTYNVIAFGRETFLGFEKRSFAVIEEISEAASLEKQLPEFSEKKLFSDKKNFLRDLADFVRRFHSTGYRHRDLYLCHIFYDHKKKNFYLIDLARAFKPLVLKKRFLIKDLAQLYYSSPGSEFSKTDKLRFYLFYQKISKLTSSDKNLIKRILKKVRKMARHDIKRNKTVPYKE